ncbi:hypothetical protein K469DRAFT_517615, partial [Zopfia rhizophila CBS 207.26]
DRFQVRESLEEHQAMIEWLSPVDPCENHETAISSHQPGTCSWIFKSEEFEKWHHRENSFLWISGFAGVGKTVLFSNVVEYVKQTDVDTGVAYFYCDFTQSECQDPRNIIGSLVAQLCSQFPYPQDLTIAYKASQSPGRKSRPRWDTLRYTLREFSKSRKVLLLIDALDECEKREE